MHLTPRGILSLLLSVSLLCSESPNAAARDLSGDYPARHLSDFSISEAVVQPSVFSHQLIEQAWTIFLAAHRPAIAIFSVVALASAQGHGTQSNSQSFGKSEPFYWIATFSALWLTGLLMAMPWLIGKIASGQNKALQRQRLTQDFDQAVGNASLLFEYEDFPAEGSNDALSALDLAISNLETFRNLHPRELSFHVLEFHSATKLRHLSNEHIGFALMYGDRLSSLIDGYGNKFGSWESKARAYRDSLQRGDPPDRKIERSLIIGAGVPQIHFLAHSFLSSESRPSIRTTGTQMLFRILGPLGKPRAESLLEALYQLDSVAFESILSAYATEGLIQRPLPLTHRAWTLALGDLHTNAAALQRFEKATGFVTPKGRVIGKTAIVTMGDATSLEILRRIKRLGKTHVLGNHEWMIYKRTPYRVDRERLSQTELDSMRLEIKNGILNGSFQVAAYYNDALWTHALVKPQVFLKLRQETIKQYGSASLQDIAKFLNQIVLRDARGEKVPATWLDFISHPTQGILFGGPQADPAKIPQVASHYENQEISFADKAKIILLVDTLHTGRVSFAAVAPDGSAFALEVDDRGRVSSVKRLSGQVPEPLVKTLWSVRISFFIHSLLSAILSSPSTFFNFVRQKPYGSRGADPDKQLQEAG